MSKNITMVLLLSIGVAIIASFFASGSPDGLEWVAENLGFLGSAGDTPGAMPDYLFPGVNGEGLATAAAGVIGVALTFGIFLLAAKLLKAKKA